MEPAAGVFRSREDAVRAFMELRRAGYSPDDINVLTPGASEDQIHKIPVSETEQPGVGGAIGGVVGAALGMAGGFELGFVVSALIPGVGPVLAAGIAGAALLGAGGAVGGMAAGAAAERDSTPGLPSDEVFFYEDALRQGRSVVVVLGNGKAEAQRAREIMAEAGAESLDAARHDWWLGLRDAESEHYRARGYNFEKDHDVYRAGFEAAQRRPVRGKTYAQAAGYLKQEFPETWESDAFRTGFDRGQEFQERRLRSHTS